MSLCNSVQVLIDNAMHLCHIAGVHRIELVDGGSTRFENEAYLVDGEHYDNFTRRMRRLYLPVVVVAQAVAHVACVH